MFVFATSKWEKRQAAVYRFEADRKADRIIDFPIKAPSGKEAAKIARAMPRVKHHYQSAIKSCEEITFEEFQALIAKNALDPYLHCHCIQEQRRYPEIKSRVILGKRTKAKHHDKDRIRFRRKKEKSALQCIDFVDDLFLDEAYDF